MDRHSQQTKPADNVFFTNFGFEIALNGTTNHALGQRWPVGYAVAVTPTVVVVIAEKKIFVDKEKQDTAETTLTVMPEMEETTAVFDQEEMETTVAETAIKAVAKVG